MIYATYNIRHNSIDVYTYAGYFLRINCNKAEEGFKHFSFYIYNYICKLTFYYSVNIGIYNQTRLIIFLIMYSGTNETILKKLYQNHN